MAEEGRFNRASHEQNHLRHHGAMLRYSGSFIFRSKAS